MKGSIGRTQFLWRYFWRSVVFGAGPIHYHNWGPGHVRADSQQNWPNLTSAATPSRTFSQPLASTFVWDYGANRTLIRQLQARSGLFEIDHCIRDWLTLFWLRGKAN